MKPTITLLLALCFLMAVNHTAYSQMRKINWLEGTWTGIGFQANALTQNTWEIILTYNKEAGQLSIEYPSFPCNGYWELQEASRHKAVFIEYIAEGKNRCQDEGIVVVTKIDENYITVSYFTTIRHDGVVAFSTLRKQITGFR